MPYYNITAKRETIYEFEIEADTEDEAIAQIESLQLTDEVEQYAIDWYPLEIDFIELMEEEK